MYHAAAVEAAVEGLLSPMRVKMMMETRVEMRIAAVAEAVDMSQTQR